MALEALLARLEAESVTPVTLPESADVTAKPAPVLACTAVTSVTSPADVTVSASIRRTAKRDSADVATVTLATPATDGSLARPSVATVATITAAIPPKHESASASLWLLHFPDLDPLAVAFAPAVDHAGALASYPAAIAAEPMPETVEPVPADLAAMFDACATAELYDDANRASLPAMLALDAGATRGLIEDMHSRIGRCRRCRHFRRPGLSDGYCTERDDLPHAYGFMHRLPDDGGARCDAFDEGRGW